MKEYIFLLVLLPIIYGGKILTGVATILAGIIGFLILFLTNIKWFILLVSFLLLSAIITKFQYNVKKKIYGESFSRGSYNVLANGLPALIFAILYKIYPSNIIAYSYLAVIAALMADKASSEIGILSKKNPVLITNFKPVAKGTNGGITLLGEVVGVIFALIIGIIAYAIGFINDLFLSLIITSVFGFIGNNLDSLLGAIFENKGILNKHHVNFLSSTIAGVFCLIFLFSLS